ATWTSLAAKISSDSPDNSAAGVLDRLDIPKHVRMQVEDLLTKGSSMIVTDGNYRRETGESTDFIVLTR
ncbi:MAG: L,D-transpeptidase, partial [Hyphomicrobiaceae bacterium]